MAQSSVMQAFELRQRRQCGEPRTVDGPSTYRVPSSSCGIRCPDRLVRAVLQSTGHVDAVGGLRPRAPPRAAAGARGSNHRSASGGSSPPARRNPRTETARRARAPTATRACAVRRSGPDTPASSASADTGCPATPPTAAAIPPDRPRRARPEPRPPTKQARERKQRQAVGERPDEAAGGPKVVAEVEREAWQVVRHEQRAARVDTIGRRIDGERDERRRERPVRRARAPATRRGAHATASASSSKRAAADVGFALRTGRAWHRAPPRAARRTHPRVGAAASTRFHEYFPNPSLFIVDGFEKDRPYPASRPSAEDRAASRAPRRPRSRRAQLACEPQSHQRDGHEGEHHGKQVGVDQQRDARADG